MNPDQPGESPVPQASNSRLEGLSLHAWLAVVIGAAVVFFAESIYLLARLGLPFTNEDQALLWAAAKAWQQFDPHQPNFWGQFYGTTLEAIPAGLLNWVGIDFSSAVPLALAGLFVLSWLVLAVVAWRQGRPGVTALAFLLPVLCGPSYVAFGEAYGTQVGRLLAVVVTAIVMLYAPLSRRATFLAVSLAALAALIDTSVVILLVPVAVWVVLDRTTWRSWPLALAGVVPAGIVWFAVNRFNAHRPEYGLHPTQSARLSVDSLIANVRDAKAIFSLFLPSGFPMLAVALGVIVVSVIVLACRDRRTLLTLIALASVVLLGLTSAVAHDGLNEPFFPFGRVFMCLPLALWFVAYAIADAHSRRAESAHGQHQRVVRVALAAAGVVAAIAAIATLPGATTDLAARGESEILVPRVGVDGTVDSCTALAVAARAADADAVVLYGDRSRAYACSVTEEDVTFIAPEYDRRAWLYDRAVGSPGGRFLVTSMPVASPCSVSGLVRCEPDSAIPGTWALDAPEASIVDVMRALGLPVRAYW